MNAFLLMIPLFLIRFGLLGVWGKKALGRAALFAPMADSTKATYILYQVANLFIVIFPLFLKVRTTPPLFYIGLGVYVAGLVVLIISTIDFARPAANGLNCNGIFKISRNPMYMGYYIYFLGCGLLTQSIWLLVAVLVFVVSSHWIIPAEEKWCIEKFGCEYVDYMKRVRQYI